jgi:hypothetical protein
MKGLIKMRIELRDKKKNPDYNNIIHIPESKWKWVINATTNKCISPNGISLKLWGWTSQTRTFSLMVKEIENNQDLYGFCSVEVQPTGGMIHYHSVWDELKEIETIKQLFKDNTGPGKKFINSFIEPYKPRHITEKDFLWYMLKHPQDVYYTDKLMFEIGYYQNKVKTLEKRLQREPGYFVPSRFNHLKHFLSKESQDNDLENCLNHVLKGGDSNGK